MVSLASGPRYCHGRYVGDQYEMHTRTHPLVVAHRRLAVLWVTVGPCALTALAVDLVDFLGLQMVNTKRTPAE